MMRSAARSDAVRTTPSVAFTSTMATRSRCWPARTSYAVNCSTLLLREVSDVPEKCSQARVRLPSPPSGSRTVPVTVPIGIWLDGPNGSHWNVATSSYAVVTPSNVIVTSKRMLSASTVTGMFQPISTTRCSPMSSPGA